MKFSIENILSYDKRDRPVLPETGYLAKHGLEIAALLGDSSFVRNELLLQVSFFSADIFQFIRLIDWFIWFRVLQNCHLVRSLIRHSKHSSFKILATDLYTYSIEFIWAVIKMCVVSS
jgi:hypothetical protein